MSLLRQFVKDETGATAIEYGLIGTLIAAALIGGAAAMGDSLINTLWCNSRIIEGHSNYAAYNSCSNMGL